MSFHSSQDPAGLDSSFHSNALSYHYLMFVVIQFIVLPSFSPVTSICDSRKRSNKIGRKSSSSFYINYGNIFQILPSVKSLVSTNYMLLYCPSVYLSQYVRSDEPSLLLTENRPTELSKDTTQSY